jgi:hypothetical protein
MSTARHAVLLAVGAALALPAGCKKRETDNPDVASEYRGEGHNKYESEIVTARKRNTYEDQGKGIDPRTLNSIDDTIRTVYLRDLERCLEDQMNVHETRFLRSVFTVEFHIDTKGQASDAKILKMWLGKQDAKGSQVGDLDPKDLQTCFVDSIAAWEFDPAPEAEFVHTYQGQVGEAF